MESGCWFLMKRLHSRWVVKYMAFIWNMCAHKHELAYTFLSRVSGFIDLKRINLTCFACLFGSRSSNDAEQQQTQTQHDGVQSSLLAFAGGLWRQKTNHIYSGVGQGITATSESGNPDKADIITTLQLRLWTSVKPLYTGLWPSCHLWATRKLTRTFSGHPNPESSVSV